MKRAFAVLFIVSFLTACNENTTEVNTQNPQVATNPSSNDTAQTKSEDHQKSDAEVILDLAKATISTTKDIVRQKQIKDSINLAHKEKYYAFQIGFKLHKKDAIDLYKKLNTAGITSIYIFNLSKKENYIVKFEAKGEEELKLAMGDFKTQLGDFGTDGLKIINLTDAEFCSKKETISKLIENEDGIEIKYLTCE